MSARVENRLLAVYAATASGRPGADAQRVVRAVAETGCATGLEVPFTDAGEEPWLRSELLAPLPGGSVVTLIPALFAAARRDASVGLASGDHAGRTQAVAIADRARRLVQELNRRRPGTVLAVECQSSPHGESASAEAFAQSLGELAARDWGGAELLIEHCDSPVAGRAVQKGFLPLPAELDVASELDLGVVVNWGRSAIECRDADGALGHVDAAREAGRLRGLVLSGAASVDTAYGPAWADVHVPPVSVEPRSLLTAERAADALALARRSDGLLFVGAKYAAAPADGDDARIALLQHAAAELGGRVLSSGSAGTSR